MVPDEVYVRPPRYMLESLDMAGPGAFNIFIKTCVEHMGYPLVSSNTACWKILYELRFYERNITYFNGPLSSQLCLMKPEVNPIQILLNHHFPMVFQRVLIQTTYTNPIKPYVPMVFLWFSIGFWFKPPHLVGWPPAPPRLEILLAAMAQILQLTCQILAWFWSE